MTLWRFKISAFFAVLCSLVEMGFSLIFVTTVVVQPIVTFVFAIASSVSLILVCASHNYANGKNMFVERLGICVYNMLAAVKIMMFASDVVCNSCTAAAVTRMVLAFAENALSNVIYAHIWRRTEEEIFYMHAWPANLVEMAIPRREKPAESFALIPDPDPEEVTIDDAATQPSKDD
jgi:hypothetical protein